MARKKKPEMEVTSETGVTVIEESFVDDVSETMPRIVDGATPEMPLTKDIPSLERDPLASDADVCECHHARGRHRGGKDDCEGNGAEPCDTKCVFFMLKFYETPIEGGSLRLGPDPEPEPAASAETPAEEPRPEPVAVDDKDLLPKAPADIDVTKLGRTTREVSTPLSAADTAQLGMKLADANTALNKHNDDAARTRKALKEEEARLQKEIDSITKQIHEGVRTSVVLCFELPNPDAKRVEMYTLDDREFVGSRPMSEGEYESARQIALFPDTPGSETPIGADTMPTTPIPIEAECAECGHAQEHHGKDHRPDGCIVDGCPCRGFVALPEPEPQAEEPTPEEEAEAHESEQEAA